MATPTAEWTLADGEYMPHAIDQLIIMMHQGTAAAFDRLMATSGAQLNHDQSLRMIYGWAVTFLLAHIQRALPAEQAEHIASSLADAIEAGDAFGEWLWQWGEELQAGKPITLPGTQP